MSAEGFTGRHVRRQGFIDAARVRMNDKGLKVSDILERVGRSDIEEED